jgi:hypothetical protein
MVRDRCPVDVKETALGAKAASGVRYRFSRRLANGVGSGLIED